MQTKMKGRMKSIFKLILAMLLPLLFWTGCGREPLPLASEIPNNCIEITLGGLHPTLATKASTRGEDAYNENLVESVDCFFYRNGETDSDAVFSAIGRGAEAVAEGDSTVYKVKVFFTDADAMNMFGSKVSGTCQLFVICNAPISYNSNNTSVEELKQLVVENDFTAQTIQSSFVMSADEVSTVSMSTVDDKRTGSGRIKVSRAAAKIQFFLMIPELFMDDENHEWEPVLTAGIGISMTNAVKKGKVDGEYTVLPADYVSYSSRPLEVLDNDKLIPGHTDYTYTHVPFYSYPSAWSDLSDYACTVVFRIPWKRKEATDYEWKKYQLSPNISTLDLKRNHYYRTFVAVRSLGGADKESDVIIPDADYVVLPWMNESASASGQGVVPGELTTYKYLVLDLPEQTLNNQNTAYFTYVSSSPIESVKITSIDYYDNTQANPLQTQTVNRTVTADSQSVSTNIGDITINKETPGLVTISHSLENMYSAITIYATIKNEDNCEQNVIITQNPSISLERETDAGDVFVNGFFARVSNATYANSYTPYYDRDQDYIRVNGSYYKYNSSSGYYERVNRNPQLSGGSWVQVGEYEYYYYTDTQTYYHCSSQWSNDNYQQIIDGYNSTYQSGSYGTILGSTANLNETIDKNFYTTLISVSSFNNSNDYYTANSEETHYRIGDPRVKASTVYTGSESWDTVTNFYKYLYYSGSTESYAAWESPGDILINSQAEEDRNIIAPRLLVSSGLNANSGLTFDVAVKRGATYQEAGYPAGRWRLPSEAEIAFIVARQRDGVIPNLYATDTYYWTGSGRLVYVPDNASSQIMFYTESEAQSLSGDDTFSVRYVYDLWYWGDDPSTTNVYHPNGHLYYYDAEGNATLIRL